MDFLGIGPLELFFIVLIALIIFGPNDIVKAARSIGKFLRKVVTSEGYSAFRQVSKGIKDMPTTLMREAGLEESDLRQLSGYSEIEDAAKDFENQISHWTTIPTSPPIPENSIGTTPPENTPAPPANPEPDAEPETGFRPDSSTSTPPPDPDNDD